jgi:acetyltransferase-like isoleucine patch superfamily enzyme
MPGKAPILFQSACSFRRHMKNNKYIKLGKGHKFDKSVIVGYKPQRKINDFKLNIGLNAHIRAGSIIYLGSQIGDNLETGHNVIIREENHIGNNFAIWNNSVVDYGCRIGNNVKVHSNCYVAQFTTLEDNVFLAPGVTIANDLHPDCQYSKKCMKGPTIKRGAQIGVNTTILPFVTIGAGAIIGSGSVVAKDIPDFAVAYGNPCKVMYKNRTALKCRTGLTDRPYHQNP